MFQGKDIKGECIKSVAYTKLRGITNLPDVEVRIQNDLVNRDLLNTYSISAHQQSDGHAMVNKTDLVSALRQTLIK